MFENLQLLPVDPILGLMAEFRVDTNSNKIDLGVGVYKDEDGKTNIMEAVKRAEKVWWETEDTKTYIGMAGEAEYNAASQQMILGADHPALTGNRVRSAQTPGGCGALRMGAEFLMRGNPGAKIWVSNPTWANHVPLLGGAGLQVVEYTYFDKATNGVNFDAMMADLAQATAGDIVLLHGCCHNPTGADLSKSQWAAVADLAEANGFLPYVDLAYQGFGKGIDEDAYGTRLLAERVPEMIIAASCSKNFGLYRERTGTLMIISANPEQADVSASQAMNVIRGNYSMPPSHGAAVVRTILNDPALYTVWTDELTAMRNRINDLRQLFVEKTAAKGTNHNFSFIAEQQGMFSFLGITPEQIQTLKKDYSIYIVGSSRINIAGISKRNIDYLVDSLFEVL